MAKQKSAAELRAENRLLRRMRQFDGVYSVLRDLIRWAAVVFIVYWIGRTIGTLAGKVTMADIGIRFLAEVRLSEAVAGIFGVTGLGYGLTQRRLRRNTIERLQGRIQELERRLDPNRTSSQLTERGETRPEDQK